MSTFNTTNSRGFLYYLDVLGIFTKSEKSKNDLSGEFKDLILGNLKFKVLTVTSDIDKFKQLLQYSNKYTNVFLKVPSELNEEHAQAIVEQSVKFFNDKKVFKIALFQEEDEDEMLNKVNTLFLTFFKNEIYPNKSLGCTKITLDDKIYMVGTLKSIIMARDLNIDILFTSDKKIFKISCQEEAADKIRANNYWIFNQRLNEAEQVAEEQLSIV